MADYRITLLEHTPAQYPVEETANTPPSHVLGLRVLVGDAPTGVFVGHENEIAWSDGIMWSFDQPQEGWVMWHIFDEVPYIYTFQGWVVDSYALWWHNNQSAGRLWGGIITPGATAGKVNIAAGGGVMKLLSSDLETVPTGLNAGQASVLAYVEWSAITGFDLADVGYNLIFWDASAGTFVASLREDFYSVFDFTRDFTIGRVYYDGTNVIVRLCGIDKWNFERRVQMFGEEVFPIIRGFGLEISATNRQFSVNAGVIWAELVNRFSVSAKTLAANFTYWYTINNVWTTSTVNEINNTQYNNNNPTTGLVNLTTNRWRVDYVYVVHDSTYHVVMGAEQYNSEANAQAAAIRTPPPLLSAYATLIGRITIQQGASVMTADSPFTTSFSGSAIPEHNGLAGLQGGTASEYFHLTSALNTMVGTISTTNGILKSNGSGTITAAAAGTDYQAPLSKAIASDVNTGTDDAKYVTSKAIKDSNVAYKTIQVTGLTLAQASWNPGVSFNWEYELSNANITADSIVEIVPDNSNVQTVIDAFIYPATLVSAGMVTIYAEEFPTGNIGVTINVQTKSA